MKKEEKNQLIDSLAEQLQNSTHIFLTDISHMNVESSNKLRRMCFKKDIKLEMVKNTLLKKAMERTNRDFDNLYSVLRGSTSIMLCDIANVPPRLIQEFRRTSPKPILKGAFVEETVYIGDDQLDALVNIKSKNELVGDLIALLQSPAKRIISALQSGGNNLSGIVKTLSEKPE